MIQPGIEEQQMHSNILNLDLELLIKLPWRYVQTNTKYPVLFCLDANRSFPLYSTMSLIYETPGPVTKEIIIVGVGYKLDPDRLRGLAQWAAWRTRDLTPVRDEETEHFWEKMLSPLLGGENLEVQSGGAPRFLRSIKEEIIPIIETNYRVSKIDRGLAGYSYGGLFVLYALFHTPELFTHYFAGSPTMWNQLFKYEKKYALTHRDLKARLFLTAGSNETDLQDPIRRMIECLQSREYPGLEILSHVFEGEGHASAYAPAVSRALCELYNKDWMKN